MDTNVSHAYRHDWYPVNISDDTSPSSQKLEHLMMHLYVVVVTKFKMVLWDTCTLPPYAKLTITNLLLECRHQPRALVTAAQGYLVTYLNRQGKRKYATTKARTMPPPNLAATTSKMAAQPWVHFVGSPPGFEG